MTLLCVLNGPESHAQLRVSGYHTTDDSGGDFQTSYQTDYRYGSGMTNISFTNLLSGYIVYPNITGRFSTNGCGWDTTNDSLSTTRQVDIIEQLDDSTYTNSYSGTETWSGEGPSFYNGEYPAINMGWRTARVDLDYLIGGDTNNPLTRAYEITVTAKENGTQVVAPSEISVNGTPCDGGGNVTVTWTDCSTNSVAVTFPAARTNVYYTVAVAMMRPQIFLVTARYATDEDVETNTTATLSLGDTLYSTNLVTDATNSITVGEKVTLFCKFGTDPAVTPTNAPAITAWNWTIGGKTISNYVANASQGKVNETYTKAQQNCTFYWTDGTTNAVQVKCDATVNGGSVPALAFFNVVQPENAFMVTIKSDAGFDDTYLNPTWPEGTYSLHWGNNRTSVGFSYHFSQTANTNWGLCQKITSTRKRTTNGNKTKTVGTDVLDSLFPYNAETDSPARGVGPADTFISVDDQFIVWLMYNPRTPSSIWVPVYSTSQFGWSGQASRPDVNSIWNATTANSEVGPVNSDKTTEFPQWNNNIRFIAPVPDP